MTKGEENNNVNPRFKKSDVFASLIFDPLIVK